MKGAIKLLTLASAIALAVPGSTARAESLWDALAMAYRNNPTLEARRAALRAVDETVSQALSGWRPTVSANVSAGRRSTDNSGADSVVLDPRSGEIRVSQPLFRGFRTVEGTRQAEADVLAGREDLRSTEQQVLLDAVVAYVDVLRDQAVVELRSNNERVLARQLEATKDRFEVGELTRTDVAQSEARRSRATSERIRAEGELVASRARYERVVGVPPGALEPTPPLQGLPQNEDQARQIAEQENPLLGAARHRRSSATYAVRVATGALLPTVDVVGELSRSLDGSTFFARTNNAGISAQMSIPLYQSGRVWSEVRQSRQVLNQRAIEISEARRAVLEAVTQAWEALQTARARIRSDSQQVRANDIALEGVREEATVGARTILDILDAEQELLDSQVSLVRTERDEYVEAYRLRQALGRLTAGALGLGVEQYDPNIHYNAVRNRLIGTEGSPFGD